MINFYPPTEEHCRILADNMRPEEVAEVWASGAHTPYEAIVHSLGGSIEAATAMDGERLICITGLFTPSLLGDAASPWLLTTIHSKKSPRHLLRHTKTFVDKWRQEWALLVNYVDARYEASIRWAKWAGFTVHEARPYGHLQLPFHKIEIRRD